ncbi:ligase-associated DNA damage response endonuclease PdeM [Novosphingobium sp.]|uniref:ligase-associated DNA damage response endonuclease PdeM n=1 Tax=Novosphingobium sp. TaxID=1874826 RepID=UPI0033428659
MVHVSFAPFAFQAQEFGLGTGPDTARALYWAEERALLVADLHLEKASYFATHGQMLPPYDSRETLERLAVTLRVTGARRVFCLGDNFHDAAGPGRLDPHAAGMLAALTRATDWVWITGNHDTAGGPPAAHDTAGKASASATVPGTHLDETCIAGVILRHEARPGETRPELSGHFHPRLRVVQRGRTITRACVVASESRMVLPAFGALTGGLDAHSPAIRAALDPARRADALVPAAGKVARFALWRTAA